MGSIVCWCQWYWMLWYIQMTRCLYRAKPFPRQVVTYCQLNPKQKNSMRFQTKLVFIKGNQVENVVGGMTGILFRSQCDSTWWRHQVETVSALLVLCKGNPPIYDGFLSQRPVTRSFDIFFDTPLNKQLSKPSRFETPVRSSWRLCNDMVTVCSPCARHEANAQTYTT